MNLETAESMHIAARSSEPLNLLESDTLVDSKLFHTAESIKSKMSLEAAIFVQEK